MRGLIYKSNYKPRYWWWFIVNAEVQVIDGLVGLLVRPFGYSSDILGQWSEYNLRLDVERSRERREKLKWVN